MHVGANWEIKGEKNLWDNGKEGNYWDNYAGLDNNRDGIGDTPYIVEGTKWDDNADGLVGFVYGQDKYPLIAPFDIDIVVVDYPNWVYSLLNTEPPIPTPFPEPQQNFPTTIVIAVILTVIIGLGILVYSIRKRTYR